MPIAPVGPVQLESTGVGPQVNRSNAGFPCAVVYDLLRALPGDRAFLPPSPARCASIAADLTPASGRQDHTTSPSAMPALVARRHPRPPHPTATFRDVRNAPLIGRDARIKPTDLPDEGSGIFLCRGLDRANRIDLARENRFLAQGFLGRRSRARARTPCNVSIALAAAAK